MRNLIIVRTHKADLESFAAFDLYSSISGYEVTFCCDERRGTLDMGGRSKLGFDTQKLDALGLFAPPDVGWRCGDYFYIVTRLEKPEFDYYWLIEPDVFINFADISLFFRAFEGKVADFLAMGLSQRAAHWGWHHAVKENYPVVYGCIFPISRISGRAIDHIYAVRKAASECRGTKGRWPNDESFVASELMHSGFVCADFNSIGKNVYARHTFRVGSLHRRETIVARGSDDLVYHPVCSAQQVSSAFEEAERLIASIGSNSNGSFIVSKPQAARLAKFVRQCPTYPKMHGAILAPLMMLRHALNESPWATANRARAAGATLPEANTSSDKFDRRIDEGFGTQNGKRPAIATAYVVRARPKVAALKRATPVHFECSGGQPLGMFPKSFALPYAFDFARRELVFTMHTCPSQVLAEPFLYAAQRAQARVVGRVPWSSLRKIYGKPDPNIAPVLIFSLGHTGSDLLHALITCANSRCISYPGTVTQLAARRDYLQALNGATRRGLIRHSIGPFFQIHSDAAGEPRCIIQLGWQANALVQDYVEVFPRARFVFMVQQRQAWARSELCASQMRPAGTVSRLVRGLENLKILVDAGVDHTVVHFEELLAAPEDVVARILDLEQPLSPDLVARMSKVIDTNSQARSSISRERALRVAPEENTWMAAFDAEWERKRPETILKALSLSLG